ncbi:unnamed protein product, partial [Iphiclides podalirius]
MLALIGDQIIPLSNACDSAAEYYEQNEAEIAGPQPEQDAIDVTIPIHDSENESCAFVAELSAKKIIKKKINKSPHKEQTIEINLHVEKKIL